MSSWDDWVPQDRLRKLTDDNKELAANLRRELTQQLQPKSAAKPAATSKSRKQGSELGSGRGSEERHSSVPAGGRGTKRGRDNDIEKVRPLISLPCARSLQHPVVCEFREVRVPKAHQGYLIVDSTLRLPPLDYSVLPSLFQGFQDSVRLKAFIHLTSQYSVILRRYASQKEHGHLPWPIEESEQS